MPIDLETTLLPGVLLCKPRVFPDPRGFFLETYHREKYREAGIDVTFVQDNHSHSVRNTLRGVHFQLRRPQAKLVTVIRGEILDLAVDVRRGSPTYGQWTSAILSDQNHHQLFVPEGFAHGFCVLSDEADVLYKCSALYDPHDEVGFCWNSPAIGIDWGVTSPLLSDKDAVLPDFEDLPPDRLPVI